MPRNQSQRMVFAFLTVLITVHAYVLEILVGSPCSFRLAYKKFDPRKDHPMIFESAIINATVGIMCPAMSLIAVSDFCKGYQGTGRRGTRRASQGRNRSHCRHIPPHG